MGQAEPLKSPPLVEVILEVRWRLQQGGDPNLWHDPHYSLVVGKLHDHIKAQYPVHEQLPTAVIPDELSAYNVKHRFRAEKDGWPLVQIGPGILTLNEAQKYTTFSTFRPRAVSLVNAFFQVYPERPKVSALLLRYIDAVEIDYTKENVWQFLGEKMHVPMALPSKFFESLDVEKQPLHFVWECSFPCTSPRGKATLRFATGKRGERPALIWEQMVRTSDDDVPPMPGAFQEWLDSAHALTKAWFLKLIEGELKERFSQ